MTAQPVVVRVEMPKQSWSPVIVTAVLSMLIAFGTQYFRVKLDSHAKRGEVMAQLGRDLPEIRKVLRALQKSYNSTRALPVMLLARLRRLLSTLLAGEREIAVLEPRLRYQTPLLIREIDATLANLDAIEASREANQGPSFQRELDAYFADTCSTLFGLAERVLEVEVWWHTAEYSSTPLEVRLFRVPWFLRRHMHSLATRDKRDAQWREHLEREDRSPTAESDVTNTGND